MVFVCVLVVFFVGLGAVIWGVFEDFFAVVWVVGLVFCACFSVLVSVVCSVCLELSGLFLL